MIKKIITTIAILISLGCFGQKDSLWSIASLATRGNVLTITPQKDTVGVICLVSDTAPSRFELIKMEDSTHINYGLWVIKCKAVRESRIIPETTNFAIYIPKQDWQITEYLLPKKYIVWQSVIINKTK